MNCQDANLSLQLALDGEITPAEHERLDRHLSTCLPCRRMEAWLDEIKGGYATVEALDGNFADDVVQALRQGEWLAAGPPLMDRELRRETVPAKPKRSWLRRLWGMARFGFRRRRPVEEKPARWTSSAAGSMVFGFKTIRPGVQPAVAGSSMATFWLRGAGLGLRAPARRFW
jgi:anti-sigma factor RsiW